MEALNNGLKYLTNFPQFVAWIGIPQANGKVKKLLINPHTGRNASSANPATWGTAEQALAFCQANPDYHIGFVFSETDDLFFFDIDDAREADGSWSDWAKYLVSMFPGAFVEESQSRRGLHIIGRGKKPEGFRCKSDANWDLYVSKRFVALTGFEGKGDAGTYDHTVSVDAVTREHLPVETQHSVSWTDVPVEGYTFQGSDEELVALLMKSKSLKATFDGAASFKDIWTRNLPVLEKHFPNDQGIGIDESRLESALCSHLAWATGKNPQRIENIVNNWEHVREKWLTRGKYREDTILKTCAICSDDVYSKVDDRVTEFVKQLPTMADVGPSSDPIWMNGITPGGDYGKDHTPNAIEFLRSFYDNGNYLKYVDEDFYRYNGKVWEMASSRTIEAELNHAMLAASPQAAWIDGTLKQVQRICTDGRVRLGAWDDRDTSSIIVYQNGIVDLSVNEFLPHTPRYMTTNIMPYEYDNTAKCEQWVRFLEGTLEGDQERINMLQEWMGYLLVNDYSFHKAMMLIGQSRSGKGTIGRVLRLLVGSENYSAAGLEDLAVDANLDALRNKPVAFDGDAHSISNNIRGTVLTRFKKITGNDAIRFTRKYKSSLDATLPTRFTIAANNMISFNDDSGALLARLLVLPFNKSWRGKEDQDLDDKLASEIQGIANWAIQGLFRLRQNRKFTEPSISVEELHSLEESYSPIRQFADIFLEFSEGGTATSKQLFHAFQIWCKSENRTAGTQSSLTQHMKNTYRGEISYSHVLDPVTNLRVRGFKGVSVKSVGNVVPFPAKQG